ncbi:arylesterase [Nitrospira sp.]|nr:arylesterase [Nitrospira sp.]
MQPPLPVILCFGDSLTAGFQSPTPSNPMGQETPYGDWLQELLGTRGTVRVSGICGEVTGEMVLRFSRDVIERKPVVVAILGGTNDLGLNAQPAEIMRNLSTMYARAGSAGVVPIPITVPSIRVDPSGASPEAKAWIEDHLARRRQLNRLILEYATTRKLPFLDLFEATADATTQMLTARYSNDGLHLSTEGYRVFGSLLYERVFAPRLDELVPRSRT